MSFKLFISQTNSHITLGPPVISLTKENVSLQLFESALRFHFAKRKVIISVYIDNCNNNSILAAMCHLTENSNADKFLYSYLEKGCRIKCPRQPRKVLWVVLSSLFLKKFERMAGEALDICLRVLKESNKSRFDSYSVRNSVLIISHITFRDCRVHIFSDNLSRNSCMSSRLALPLALSV